MTRIIPESAASPILISQDAKDIKAYVVIDGVRTEVTARARNGIVTVSVPAPAGETVTLEITGAEE